MSQGKVLVEFKKANGGGIEVSEEKFLQSQLWFERINAEPEPQAVDGEVDNFNDADHSYDEDEDKDKDRETSSPDRENSPDPFSEVTNTYPDEPPKTPALIIRNTAKIKPFTPPTISNELRQKMIAQRLNDRKRKADDELPAPSTPAAPVPTEPSLVITPEMRERARKSREAALAIRRSLQKK